jgi:hypothetical protein
MEATSSTQLAVQSFCSTTLTAPFRACKKDTIDKYLL